MQRLNKDSKHLLSMVTLSEVSILYAIAQNIKINCNYYILNNNAVPLQTCFEKSELDTLYKSYQFVCNNLSLEIEPIIKYDYLNSSCIGEPYNMDLTNINRYEIL